MTALNFLREFLVLSTYTMEYLGVKEHGISNTVKCFRGKYMIYTYVYIYTYKGICMSVCKQLTLEHRS